MSLSRHLRKALSESNSLRKADDPSAYKKLADEGLLLGHPVKINGKDSRDDNGVKYHTSIKFFNNQKDDPEEIHKIASKLGTHPPHPEATEIEPGTIKSRAGDDIYVIKLKGPHIDKLKEHHKKFSHMGHKENYDFHPHISVSKEQHDRIKASGAKTAHEAGIEFGHAELKRGPKVLQNYGPKKEEKLAASEALVGAKLSKSENLTPSIIKETILTNRSLLEYKKALFLDDSTLANYLQDNPAIKNEILKKHEERVLHHFDDLDLINIALQKGIQEAYKVKRGK